MENNLKERYLQFNDVSIMAVSGFFTETIIRTLMLKYNVLTLSDLFIKHDNGELLKLVKNTKGITPLMRDDLWNIISGTVNVLKCKYLNIDPQVNGTTTRVEYFNKIGISAFDGLKFKTNNLEYFSLLLDMAKNNDFKLIYEMRFHKDKIESIINKIKVIYNYLNNKKEEQIDDIINNELEITTKELNILYNELKRLMEESKFIDMKINDIKAKIEEKQSKIKSLTK